MRILVAVMTVAGLAWPQQPRPEFEVASVKLGGATLTPGMPFKRGGPGTSDPGRITYTRMTLVSILQIAWDVQQDQILGPAWITEPGGTNSYTIVATMPPDTTKQQFQLMLQNLLVERFQIKLHHETRNVPGYELVVAAGGPKLAESDPSIPPPDTGPRTGADKDGFALLPPGHGAGVVMVNGTHAKFQSYTMGELVASYLRFFVHESFGADQGPILDTTGLTGKYDFTLKFDPRVSGDSGLHVSSAIRAALPSPDPAAGSPLDPGSGLPDLFAAVEKQLGLRLIKAKAIPWDVIVIDHAEKVPLGN